MMAKTKALAFTLAVAGFTILPASAQTVSTHAISKVGATNGSGAKWYNAAREIQILDERPVIKDFREAPSGPQQIQLPPGPQGYGGAGGGGNGGLGGGDPDALPANGLPMGNGGSPGYRTDNGGPGIPLPHADFGHAQSNIPAAGVGPRGILPSGTTTGIHGKVMPFNPTQPQMGPALGRHYNAARPTAAPQPATYNPGGGYGPSVGSGNASGSGGANSSVTGRLLRHIK